jgi:hypothetical protein
MPPPIPNFIPMEPRGIHAISLNSPLAPLRHRARISMLRMKTIIHMTAKPASPVKPRPCANKHAPVKPLRTIIPGRSTEIRRRIVVTVRTIRHRPNIQTNRDPPMTPDQPNPSHNTQ